MRVRSVVAAFGAAVLLTGLLAAPAAAGTGSSTWCSDGSGYREIPVLTSPVTVSIEIEHPPGTQHQKVFVCYSSTAVGQPSTITGGVVTLDVWTTGGVSVLLLCDPDHTTGIGPECTVPAGVAVNPANVSVTTPPTSICLVSVGSGCAAYAPGLKVTTGGSGPLVAVNAFGSQIVAVPVPQQCVAVVVTCP